MMAPRLSMCANLMIPLGMVVGALAAGVVQGSWARTPGELLDRPRIRLRGKRPLIPSLGRVTSKFAQKRALFRREKVVPCDSSEAEQEVDPTKIGKGYKILAGETENLSAAEQPLEDTPDNAPTNVLEWVTTIRSEASTGAEQTRALIKLTIYLIRHQIFPDGAANQWSAADAGDVNFRSERVLKLQGSYVLPVLCGLDDARFGPDATSEDESCLVEDHHCSCSEASQSSRATCVESKGKHSQRGASSRDERPSSNARAAHLFAPPSPCAGAAPDQPSKRLSEEYWASVIFGTGNAKNTELGALSGGEMEPIAFLDTESSQSLSGGRSELDRMLGFFAATKVGNCAHMTLAAAYILGAVLPEGVQLRRTFLNEENLRIAKRELSASRHAAEASKGAKAIRKTGRIGGTGRPDTCATEEKCDFFHQDFLDDHVWLTAIPGSLRSSRARGLANALIIDPWPVDQQRADPGIACYPAACSASSGLEPSDVAGIASDGAPALEKSAFSDLQVHSFVTVPTPARSPLKVSGKQDSSGAKIRPVGTRSRCTTPAPLEGCSQVISPLQVVDYSRCTTARPARFSLRENFTGIRALRKLLHERNATAYRQARDNTWQGVPRLRNPDAVLHFLALRGTQAGLQALMRRMSPNFQAELQGYKSQLEREFPAWKRRTSQEQLRVQASRLDTGFPPYSFRNARKVVPPHGVQYTLTNGRIGGLVPLGYADKSETQEEWEGHGHCC
ncbi:unnamed protein product [Amoebophrya sp. A120]|nr:unnamed protein product [Amoebophrya sp. A120]|eukprot:GSA120T00002416001.1